MCLNLVCDVLYVITSVMSPVMILVKTNHHCLRVGRHSLDYKDTFCSIIKHATIRLVLSFAVSND
jgi:hypothetical protein